MKASQQKELLLPIVKKEFGDLGFDCVDEFETSFIKKTDYGGIKMNFFFSENGMSGNTLFSISHKQVEKIMVEVGLPHNDLEAQKEGKRLLYTIYHIKDDYKYLLKPVKVGGGVGNLITTRQDIEDWKSALFTYISNSGNEFIQQYSILENVHRELNVSFENGTERFRYLLKGGTDSYFRFLVISWLHNDPKFNEKLKFVEERITKPNWKPYFELLKTKLITSAV